MLITCSMRRAFLESSTVSLQGIFSALSPAVRYVRAVGHVRHGQGSSSMPVCLFKLDRYRQIKVLWRNNPVAAYLLRITSIRVNKKSRQYFLFTKVYKCPSLSNLDIEDCVYIYAFDGGYFLTILLFHTR